MLEYLRIFFPVFFALNKQKEVKPDSVRNGKFYLQAYQYNILMFEICEGMGQFLLQESETAIQKCNDCDHLVS